MADEEQSDTEMWREHRKHQQAKRASNREDSAAIIKHHSVEVESKNFGAHLIVRHAEQTVDFWPGTGKWIDRRAAAINGRGVHNLLRHLGVKV